jgi:hypothetical protein
VILLFGPAPVLGIRVYWFWILLMPFGLGMVGWLTVERPWSRRVLALTRRPTAPPSRSSGLTGFGLLILASIAAGLITMALRAVLGPGLVPG